MGAEDGVSTANRQEATGAAATSGGGVGSGSSAGAHDPTVRHPARVALTLGALGVVFGDIGTSPIYTIQTIFNPDDPHPVPLTTDNVYGLVSLVFWSVTVIVTVLYVGLVLRADNNGEGGILSLITLVRRPPRRPAHASRARTIALLTSLGILGASLFLADSCSMWPASNGAGRCGPCCSPEGPLRQFVEELHGQRPPVRRVPGAAIFLNRNKHTAPLALRANVEHNQVLHERVVIVAVETAPVPVVAADQVATADDLGYRDDGITLVTLQFGYMQFTNVPRALAVLPAEQLESPIDLEHASYFLSTIDLELGERSSMPRWRTMLFLGTTALAADAALAFELPRDRTVAIGSRISV